MTARLHRLRPLLSSLKSFFCLFIAGFCLWVGVPAGMGQSRPPLRDLQSKKSTLQQQAAMMRKKKYQKMRAAQQMSQNIAVNQQRLEEEKRSLEFHEQRLDQTRDKLVFLDNRLDTTLGDAMRLGNDAGKRLRSLYMGERLSMLQMILEANDLSTLLDRLYYKRKIVAQDKQLLTDLRDKIQELNGLKQELAQQRVVIGNTISVIRVKNIQIQHSIALDKTLRDKYRNDAAFYDRAEAELLTESSNITAQIRALMSAHKTTFSVVPNSTGSFMWPIRGRINSGFGYRYHPIHHRTIMHTGLDIGGPNGGAIHAADGGQIIWAGWKGGYGKAVMINHGDRGGRNLVTLYGHMSRLAVSVGQNVGKGEVVGYEGSTGYSTGPHLHFEVRVNGAPVNPKSYL